MTDLIDQARAWMASDPDPTTRAELERLIAQGDGEELTSRMKTVLEFGTAGIRGQVGAGPGRINRAVVIRTTWGLARHVLESSSADHQGPVVVGFDARPTSRQFAEDAAGVLAAAGIAVLYFPDFTPTPLVAYAAKHLHAVAAVVITASHNPPTDNGYKVYGPQASQIVSPLDVEIQRAIESAPGANEIERIEGAFSTDARLISEVSDDILDHYWREVSSTRARHDGSSLAVVYTPIHGVGRDPLFEIMRRAGHTGIVAVPEQAEPDGTFPTVDFPNPEEPGALDLALEMAKQHHADLILANDPDADRLAVVVPGADGWRPLSGNEIGVLLADYLLSHDDAPEDTVVASSIVSSPMLARIAASYGAMHEFTLTGFKWIVRAGLSVAETTGRRFIFGYEEALGYTVGETVRDKDGISAALIFTDLVADLRDEGRFTLDYLHDLWSAHGLWVSGQTSIARSGPEGLQAMRSAIDILGEQPPDVVEGITVTRVTDFRRGAGQRTTWLGQQDLIELTLGEEGRVLVRPSGTEPKLKIYVDLRGRPGDHPDLEYEALSQRVAEIGAAVEGLIEL